MDELGGTPEPCVVVGVNGSGTALRAVRWAAAEAHRRRVPLRIVHAAPHAVGNPLDEQRAVMVVPRDAHVLDPEVQDAARPVVDTAVTAPRSGDLRPHDRGELW